MSEIESPLDFWGYLRDMERLTKRKARLAASAACARAMVHLADAGLADSVALSEAFADGEGSGEQLLAWRDRAAQIADALLESQPDNTTTVHYHAAIAAKAATSLKILSTAQDAIEGAACALQAAMPVRTTAGNLEVTGAFTRLLRDIFGNPFRPVSFDSHWRTSDVVGLARAIYEDRAFDRLPILADALMDAGCADEQVLAHCRGDGPHVRGCWVVDLVLGKE